MGNTEPAVTAWLMAARAHAEDQAEAARRALDGAEANVQHAKDKADQLNRAARDQVAEARRQVKAAEADAARWGDPGDTEVAAAQAAVDATRDGGGDTTAQAGTATAQGSAS